MYAYKPIPTWHQSKKYVKQGEHTEPFPKAVFICTRAIQTHGCCLPCLTELVITEFAFRFTLWIHSSHHLKWQESRLHRNTHSNWGKKWNMLTKKAKRGLQYPPPSLHLLHWTSNWIRNKYRKRWMSFYLKEASLTISQNFFSIYTSS